MNKQQFRILFRNFLFRVVDLDLLSSHAQGGASKLLGQFAALLVMIGAFSGLGLFMSGNPWLTHEQLLMSYWPPQHFLIATTMLTVGLFAILSWDSTFPDRRDVMVLAPLPVRTVTLFFAKVAASGAALGVTVLLLNGLVAFAFAFVLAPPTDSLLAFLLSPQPYRTFVAYIFTVAAAGGSVFGGVLCLQGLAVQLLPRRLFLQASAWLQIGSFTLLICVYFLQPLILPPRAIIDPHNRSQLLNLPSYWFLGLFHQLNGTRHQVFAGLAHRAWIALAIIATGTALAYAMSYFRTLRKIVEEPDIVPGSRSGTWLPRFGGALQTAITQFSIRTLLRSRQHRVLLAFYLGIGFAITVLFLKTPIAREGLARGRVSGPLVASSIIMICAWIAGIRVVFSLPLDLRANWVFRITPIPGGPACLSARRRAMIALAVAPAILASAIAFPWLWPARPAIGHVIFLGLLGLVAAEFALLGTQKLPFTCSYLPGNSSFHMTFVLCMFILQFVITEATEFEQSALEDVTRYAVLIGVLGIALACARWRTAYEATAEEAQVQFEEVAPPVILRLGLSRDGA